MTKKLFGVLLIINLSAKAYTDTTFDLQGKVFHPTEIITGNVIIKNAIIEANPYIQIFDTTVTLINCKTKEFSAIWYGANPNNQDNSVQLQKAINACVNSMDLFIPRGNYKFSTWLKIFSLSGNTYIGACLNIYGEGGMWNDATTLTFTGVNYWAVGFQVAKGGSIHNLKIQGQFIPPQNNGIGYYSLSQSSYNDISGRCLANNYVGLAIDYDGSKNSSGSTGLRVYDMWVDGFDICYGVSRQWATYNADILRFENIRVGNCRIGFRSTQAQEKGNEIHNIVSWDNCHTLISIGSELRAQAGNYTINGGNIAGGCIRLFNINQKGWFPSHIYNVYAESIGQVGTITTGDSQNDLPISISGCVFDFAYPAQAGVQTLLTTNSCFVKFSNDVFRYYGATDSLRFSGIATYENCFFSGKVSSSNICSNYQLFITYH